MINEKKRFRGSHGWEKVREGREKFHDKLVAGKQPREILMPRDDIRVWLASRKIQADVDDGNCCKDSEARHLR